MEFDLDEEASSFEETEEQEQEQDIVREILRGRKGRPTKEIDSEVLYDVLSRGIPANSAAEELGVSVPTLNKRIAEIESKQGLLLKYRALQNLQLTELQARILEAITPEKIEQASLRELVMSYKILKERELVDTGKPTELKGIMHYLIELEKQEASGKTPEEAEDAVEAEFTVSSSEEDLAKQLPE